MVTKSRQSIKQAFIFNFLITLFSKIFAYLRIFSISFFLGLNRKTDIYFITFSIFGLLLALRWASEILIIPLFAKYRDSISKRKYLYSYFFSFSLYFGFFIFLVSFILSFVIPNFFPFSKEYKDLMKKFFLILSFSIPLVYVNVSFENIFRGERRFYLFSIYYSSLTIIQALFCFFGLYFFKNVFVIPIAFVLAHLIVFISILYLERGNIVLLPIKKFFKSKLIKKLLSIYKDSFLNYLSTKLKATTDNYFCSFLKEAQVSALNFAYFTYGSIGSVLKLDTILMTKLAEEKYFDTLLKSIFYSSFITFFISFLVFYFSYDLIKLLFEYGHFKGKDTNLVASLLKLAIFLLPLGSLNGIFSKYYFVKDKIKLTVKIYFLSIIVNAVFDYLFIFHFNLEVYGLVLATLLSACFSLGLYIIYVTLIEEKSLKKLIKLTGCIILSIVVTFGLAKLIHIVFDPYITKLVEFVHYLIKERVNL